MSIPGENSLAGKVPPGVLTPYYSLIDTSALF